MAIDKETVTHYENADSAFDDYIARYTDRLEGLRQFYTEALNSTQNTIAINSQLMSNDCPQLTIDKPARMKTITYPEQLHDEGQQFAIKFRIFSGTRLTEDPSAPDGLIRNSVPASAEQLLALRELPRLNSYEEFATIRRSCRYAAIGLDLTHVSKECFRRMLVLFPDFTTSLVQDITAAHKQEIGAQFEPELFMAYQLMSRLIDANDLFVKNSDGVDAFFLLR